MPRGIVRSLTFELPDWLLEELDLQSARQRDEDKMELAIELARRNVEHGGGPFGAAVFEAATGTVTSIGVNLVIAHSCSLLHAEVVALSLAQARLACYSLGTGTYELVTSSEPCVQCLGAIYWSGIRRLVSGARIEDAKAAGFDEGPRSAHWKAELAQKNIEVTDGVLAEKARAVLEAYVVRGGVIYNP